MRVVKPLKFSDEQDLYLKIMKKVNATRDKIAKASDLSLRYSEREELANKIRLSLGNLYASAAFLPESGQAVYDDLDSVRGAEIEVMIQSIADNYSREMEAASQLLQEEKMKETPWERELRSPKYSL